MIILLGICGEYIVNSTNTIDNLVDKIKEYELELSTDTLPSPFILKKIGIKADSDCIVKINNRNFTIKENEALEIGYGLCNICNVVAQTDGVGLTIRYLY